jgi:hypothetical protein
LFVYIEKAIRFVETISKNGNPASKSNQQRNRKSFLKHSVLQLKLWILLEKLDKSAINSEAAIGNLLSGNR